MKSAYKFLVGNSEGKIKPGRPRHRREDTIEVILKEIMLQDDSFNFAQNMIQSCS
jgi:hypothetical protein